MPEYKPVELQDRALLKSFLDKIPPYLTEHSFTTLLAWQKSFDFRFAVEDDFLFIMNTHNGVTSFFPPFYKDGKCDNSQYKAALQKIIDYAASQGLPCILSEVGENELPLIENAMPAAFSVRSDRKNANYIYSVKDLTELSGKKYHNKRNHVNQFRRSYPFYRFLPLTADLIPLCRKSVERWAAETHQTDVATVQEEADAINVLFENMEDLELHGACIEIGGEVEAFAVGEKLSDEMAYIIIEKANSKYKGLYAAINQMFLVSDWQGFQLVNRAEDMGLENLRRTKTEYHPCRLAMKYILTYNK